MPAWINPTDTFNTKNVAKEEGYWDTFYSKGFSVSIPSQFCTLAASEIGIDRPIVEFGCGNGRDSTYLASQGFDVHACDLSKEVISLNQPRVESLKQGNGNLTFSCVDASNSEQVESIIKRARSGGRSDSITVYHRFFLHAIDENQEDLFMGGLSSALKAEDEIYMEFRSKEDARLPKIFGNGHYRRYVDTDLLIEKLTNLGFSITYVYTGRGMAKYKAEDPFVSRIIARKY